MTALQVIQDHYSASARGDFAGMLAPLTSESSWTETAGFPTAGTYVGTDAIVKNVFEALGAEWDNFSAVPDHFVASGDEVVAFGVYSATYKATGKYMECRFVHHWTLRDDKVTTFVQCADTKLVRDAMV